MTDYKYQPDLFDLAKANVNYKTGQRFENTYNFGQWVCNNKDYQICSQPSSINYRYKEDDTIKKISDYVNKTYSQQVNKLILS